MALLRISGNKESMKFQISFTRVKEVDFEEES